MNSEAISATDANSMNTYRRFRIVAEKGEGAWLWDADGKRYLDFTSGIAVTTLGHSHPALTNAAKEQVENLVHVSNLFYTEPQARLASLLTELSFADSVFLCNSGTEASEGAIKLARKWAVQNGREKTIVCASGSFHGRTLGALAATSGEAYRDGFGPLPEGFVFVPYGDAGELEKAVEKHDACAFMVEPIQGESGVVIPREGFLRDARKVCDEKGALLIVDEIQTGMGRTGKMFCYEHCGMEPDVAVVAKGLGGGIPCGAVLARERVSRHFTPGSHGSTFGGGPLACRCAVAVIEEIFRSSLMENAEKRGGQFLDGLRDAIPAGRIKEARGKGLMIGVEFNSSETAGEVVNTCADKGLLTILTAGKVMRMLPPLIVNAEEVDFAVSTISESIKEVCRK